VNIRTPRIGSVCSADPNDWLAVAHDFAYELRQFIKTDRDPDRRRAAMSAISEFEDAGDDPEALQAFVEGSGQDALQAYCLPFMSFSVRPPVTTASGQTLKRWSTALDRRTASSRSMRATPGRPCGHHRAMKCSSSWKSTTTGT
jgi:hypothetical protein